MKGKKERDEEMRKNDNLNRKGKEGWWKNKLRLKC